MIAPHERPTALDEGAAANRAVPVEGLTPGLSGRITGALGSPAHASLGMPSRGALAWAAGIAIGLVAFASRAEAGILPTSDLPLNSPVAHTILRPAGETWWYTGGTYDLTDPTRLIAARNDGILERYQVNFDGSGNVTGATLLGPIIPSVGLSGLQDLVAAPGGYVAAAGTNIYLLNPDFSTANIISLTTSELTDAHVYTTLDPSANVPGLGYAIIFSTLSDNIRRLTSVTGNNVKIADGSIFSLGGLDLDSYYSNNLLTSDGDRVFNTTNMGVPTGGSTYVHMNAPFAIKGDLFGKGYFTECQNSRIDLHNPLVVQDHQIFVPEPGTLLLLLVGFGALGAANRKK